MAIVAVLLVALAAGLWFAWQRGLLGEQPLPGPLGTLQEHLRREGLPTRAAVVQRGRWEGVRQQARFQIEGDVRERSFFVVWFATPQLAEQQRERLLTAASPSHPQVRGELLLYLTDWPVADPTTQRVITAFRRWPGAGAAPP